MFKKRTRHAESRAIKKENELKRTFFENPVEVRVHPFGEPRLGKLLDKLLRISPEKLGQDITLDRSLVDVAPGVLGYEELMVLNSVLTGVDSLKFSIYFERRGVLRYIDWRWFYKELQERGKEVGLEEKWAEMAGNGIEIDARTKSKFNFPDMPISIGQVVRTAVQSWRTKMEKEHCQNPKGRAEFVRFLVVLLEMMIFKPKEIEVDMWNDWTPYRTVFGGKDFENIRAKLPGAIFSWVNHEDGEILPYSVHWTILPIVLKKFMIDGKIKGCGTIRLITATRPAGRFQSTLGNFCSANGLWFESRWFPTEILDLDFNVRSVLMVEKAMLSGLSDYIEFRNSFVIPISGFKKSHQQERHHGLSIQFSGIPLIWE